MTVFIYKNRSLKGILQEKNEIKLPAHNDSICYSNLACFPGLVVINFKSWVTSTSSCKLSRDVFCTCPSVVLLVPDSVAIVDCRSRQMKIYRVMAMAMRKVMSIY